MLEEMLAIANRYALAEEVTLNSREHKKRNADRFVNVVERPWRNKEYRPRPGEFEGFLDRIYIFHPQGKYKTRDCDGLQDFTEEVLKMTKGANQEPRGDFPEAHKQKLTAREVMAVSPATPEYLKWSEVPITFDRSDHPDFVPKPGRYPLIVSPIIKDIKLNRVLVHGGSSLNILFMMSFDQMGFSRSPCAPVEPPSMA
jgi:hypothetical protein